MKTSSTCHRIRTHRYVCQNNNTKPKNIKKKERRKMNAMNAKENNNNNENCVLWSMSLRHARIDEMHCAAPHCAFTHAPKIEHRQKYSFILYIFRCFGLNATRCAALVIIFFLVLLLFVVAPFSFFIARTLLLQMCTHARRLNHGRGPCSRDAFMIMCQKFGEPIANHFDHAFDEIYNFP